LKRSLVGLSLSAALVIPPAFAAPEEDPWEILQRAANAARDLSYQGVFTYQSATGARSVQMTHMNYGQGEYARIVVLDGSPREVLSQGRDTVIFTPRNEKVVIEKRRTQNLFPALLPTNIEVIKVSYQGRLGGQERIGGRDGQIVVLEPKDKYRYAYKFWTDREYGLLLKTVTLNERKEAMEQLAFNQLTLLNNRNMDWFQPSVSYGKEYVMAPLPGQFPSEPEPLNSWQVDKLPAGYKKIQQVTRLVPGKPAPVTQVIFSDGLASVSLFVEPLAKGVAPKVGHTAMGATNFYAHVAHGYQIVAVGEVPDATVAEIASAVSFNK